MLIKEAKHVWNALNGILCVYKPVDVNCRQILHAVETKICEDLNLMECRPPIQYVEIEGNPSQNLTVKVRPSYADHPLVVGPRYQIADMRGTWSAYLGKNTTGLLLLGINNGTGAAKQIRDAKPNRVYRVKGKLGETTDNFFKDGKVVEKSTYKHVKSSHLDHILSLMQSAHQRKMFELCGVDIQSQAAYELAVQGLLRPTVSKIPIVYGIKCVEFNSPEFTIEINCVNEYETYLKALIQEIGMKLHSTAHCIGIQCIRHSYFDLNSALLRKHWTLENIVNNIIENGKIIKEHGNLLHQKSPTLLEINAA